MIQIITTGGTIEGLEYNNESEVDKSGWKPIESFFKNVRPSFDFKIKQAFSKDSRFITSDDRACLLQSINNSQVKKILITHGTLTMVETAQYLGRLKLKKTIIITGSFVLGSSPDTDAAFNLGFAVSALNFLEFGVYISMQGALFPWDKVIKNTTKNRFEHQN